MSLFEQTKQQEDEIFYATFPEARGLHQCAPQAIPYGELFGDVAFYLGRRDFQSSGYNTLCSPPVAYNYELMNVEVSTTPLTPAQTRSVSSELMAAINPCSGESAAQIDTNSSQPTSMVGVYDSLVKVFL